MTVTKNQVSTYRYVLDLSVDEYALILRTLRRATDKNPANRGEERDIQAMTPLLLEMGGKL